MEKFGKVLVGRFWVVVVRVQELGLEEPDDAI
jgi:hypothetical protein